MKKLATQLEQARQEIAEKEAESRAFEERVAGLSQQLKDASSRIEVRLGLQALHACLILMVIMIMYCRRTQSYRGEL